MPVRATVLFSSPAWTELLLPSGDDVEVGMEEQAGRFDGGRFGDRVTHWARRPANGLARDAPATAIGAERTHGGKGDFFVSGDEGAPGRR